MVLKQQQPLDLPQQKGDDQLQLKRYGQNQQQSAGPRLQSDVIPPQQPLDLPQQRGDGQLQLKQDGQNQQPLVGPRQQLDVIPQQRTIVVSPILAHRLLSGSLNADYVNSYGSLHQSVSPGLLLFITLFA